MCEETLVLTEALGSFTRTQHGKDKDKQELAQQRATKMWKLEHRPCEKRLRNWG